MSNPVEKVTKISSAFFIFAVASMLVGCCTPTPGIVAVDLPIGPHMLKHPFSQDVPNGLFHMSCTDKYPDGHGHFDYLYEDKPQFGRMELAKRYFQMAAMSSNSYRDPKTKPRFATPAWIFVQAYANEESGLAYEIYRRDGADSAPSEIVVAFRGTENKINDWLANLAFGEPRQFREAFNMVKELKARNVGVKVTVTGHSLGGAIALNLSMRLPHLDAIAFNPSHRAFTAITVQYNNTRVVIYEVGEILSLVGGKYYEWKLPLETHYGNYNFLDYRTLPFSPAPEHGIYELTRALTVVAISGQDQDAYRFFRANIAKKEAEKYWTHCAYLYHDS